MAGMRLPKVWLVSFLGQHRRRTALSVTEPRTFIPERRLEARRAWTCYVICCCCPDFSATRLVSPPDADGQLPDAHPRLVHEQPLKQSMAYLPGVQFAGRIATKLMQTLWRCASGVSG